jgi:ATP-dependent Clp protease ATP-binding subunit ClpC
MFERFTDRARRVVVLAQEEAKMLNHNYIGTEHILLGLIHEGEGVAAKALESLNISLDAVREQVQDIIGQGQQQPTGHIPFTPRAKKVLELSLREALQLGHNYIGTEHILLGLIREGEGVAAQVLVKLGADLNRVRQQVIQLLSGFQGKEPVSAGNKEEASAAQGGSQVLDQFGRNLTQAAREGKLDPVIGREKEIELNNEWLIPRPTSKVMTRSAEEAMPRMILWRLVSFTPSSYKAPLSNKLSKHSAGKLRE